MKEERERPPLRVILQNFVNHVENLEAYRRENSYEKEFQDLKLFSENLKTVGDYCCKEGEKEINRKKNRYKDILPFDYTRVTLSEYVGVPGSDYINANYIKGASGSPAYIASQGPLPHTVNDFWRMVVECEVQVIVMACNEEESGKHKCENYWVEKEGEEKKFGMATIRLLKASTICPDFLVRTMQLKYVNAQSVLEERVVCQFHYGAWPDHGVPGLVRPLLEMVRLVRDTQASETLPVLVHCSAGCGRTGTICAIDYVWGLLRAGKLKLDFSLFQLVRDMRKQRIAMVQTKDQYILVHQAVKELFQDQLRMIHSHPYENIDIRGLPICPSLSSKAVILFSGKAAPFEEKQDEREKESSIISSSITSAEEGAAMTAAGACTSDAPPLPHKKRIHIISSKQEKEVENLTQRQLAIASASGSIKLLHRPLPVKLAESNDQEGVEKNVKKVSVHSLPTPASLTVLNHSPLNEHSGSVHQPISSTQIGDAQKPSIAKLKALFESNASVKEMRASNAGHVVAKGRLPQLVTRSHSLGAVRKPPKFTQFNAGGYEAGMQSPLSTDLCDSERYKSASNTHVDISCTNYKDVEMNLDVHTMKIESLSNSNLPSSTSKGGPESTAIYETNSHDQPTSEQMLLGKPIPTSAVLMPSLKLENPSPATCMPLGAHIFSEAPRPALPIKRSKSLKAKMSGETFKLSLSKRDHVQSQELPTSDCSVPPDNLVEGILEIKSVLKVSRRYASLCQSEKSLAPKVSNANVPIKPQTIPNSASVELNEASVPVFQRDMGEAFSSKVNINSGTPDPKVGVISPSSMKKSSIDSEKFLAGSEKNQVEHLSKPNCDVCRAQSLNLKREKSSHALKTTSQEGQYVNLKKFDSDSTKWAKEPLIYKVISEKIGDSKAPLQPHNSLPIDASSVYEHCTNYLMAEGIDNPSTSESQRIAASARHKVDTVVGGLGIRERRNSFRRAVGQGIDDKSGGTVKANKISHLPLSSDEPYSLSHTEGAPLKKQFGHQSISSVMRHESEESHLFDPPLRDLNERNIGAETNVKFKSPPPVQKFPVVSECMYIKGVQKHSENYGEAGNVQKHNKLPRMTESSPISSDNVLKSVRSNKKTASDSSSFHTSTPPWKHSVGIANKKGVHNLVMNNSNTSDALFSPSKGSSSRETHLWPTQQYNKIPHNKGNLIDAPHAVEMLGPQLNPSLVVPLEVDVDQVGASMRHNYQEKNEGIKTTSAPENSNPGNSGASTHFTRALEVFQQTAASIRTKFSWSAGSGSNSPKSSESSPKTSPVSSSQPQFPKSHLSAGGHRKGERNTSNVSDKPKILKKQQQYL